MRPQFSRRLQLLIVVAALLALSNPSHAQNESSALTHAAVVDVVAGKVVTQQTIYIRDGRIASIGSTDKIRIPANTRLVDASGLFVLPGLFNMHTHLFGTDGTKVLRPPPFKKYISTGVLGIRDLGSPLDDIIAVAKDRRSAGQPAIWFSGPIIDAPRAPNPGSFLFRYVNSEDEARNAVMDLAQSGIQFIKVHDWLPRARYLSIAQSARTQHLPLVGHVPAAVSIDDAIGAGQKSVEHLGGLTHAVLRGCSRTDDQLQKELLLRGSQENKGPAYELVMSSAYITPLLDAFDVNRCTALISRLARARVWQVPTLVLWQLWATAPLPGSDEDKSARQRLFDRYLQIVGEMYRAGVPLLAGTDEILTIEDELELLVRAGLSPAAALKTATTSAANFLGVQGTYGSIAQGHVANLILVEGNPLVDIRSLRHIKSVVLRGQQLDQTQLSETAER